MPLIQFQVTVSPQETFSKEGVKVKSATWITCTVAKPETERARKSKSVITFFIGWLIFVLKDKNHAEKRMGYIVHCLPAGQCLWKGIVDAIPHFLTKTEGRIRKDTQSQNSAQSSLFSRSRFPNRFYRIPSVL